RAGKEAPLWLRPLTEKGIQVIFEAPKPVFSSPPFRCSDWFNSMNPICKGGLAQPRTYLERLRAPILTAMNKIVAEENGIQIWDPFPTLCPGEVCGVWHQGRPLFFDGDHLSAYGNFRLYPSFK